jgi:adenylate cyclase
MSDLVMHNRGTIDKYMGDAMMAFWNAPLDDPDHARHACLAALGMQAALDPINAAIIEKAKTAGIEPALLKAGIGINTGSCAVGNMGSKQRFAYSVLGDAVNLASRLENQTKTYEVTNIIGESTCAAVPDLATLEVDLIQVKGRTQPTRIFTLLGDNKVADSKEFKTLKSMHDKMIAAYRSGEFAKALEMAIECKKTQIFGLEKFYEFYKSRADELLRNPPKDWNGVYVAKTK